MRRLLPLLLLLALVVQASPQRERYARDHGARPIPTPDGRSSMLLWEPPGVQHAPILVTLHGHSSHASDEFSLWHQECEKRGLAILAPQWWLGGEEYYRPNQLYPLIETVLRQRGTRPGEAILHGFSRGSANTYAVEWLDHETGNDFFGLVISNAGSAEMDYPPDRAIGRLDGVRWVLYAGDRDPQEHSAPAAMKRTRDWLESKGAEVVLLLEDPDGDHGGFHKHPQNMRRALDLFRQGQAAP